MHVHLARILVFPIKSLDGVVVEEARITPGGILENDRIYAMVDAAGKTVNGKREPRALQLRTRFDVGFGEVAFAGPSSGGEQTFVLAEPGPIGRWLSDYFGFTVTLIREPLSGFPDDRKAPGPTVVAEPSLRAVMEWYPGLTFENVRRRFRSNLEIDGADLPPFWDDRLFGEPGTLTPFQIGAVRLSGHNPCQRCSVPARDPDTSETLPDFQKEFIAWRRAALPPWANPEHFNHTYRLAVNTSILPSESGKWLRRGDGVELAGHAGPV
jgi:uncharacterized protein YcbX